MGKDKKKNQKKPAPAEIQQPVLATNTEVLQEQSAEQFEMPPEIVKTPQERAEEYDIQQKQSYQQIVDGFKSDDLMLQSEADFSQKIAELEKWRAVEIKKHEKTNKFILDFDDQFSQCKNEKLLQQLQERAIKTLKEICAKTQKKASSTQLSLQLQKSQIEDIKREIEANIKKRKTLQTMSELLLKKNSDLYLKHECMLDEERQRRVELGASFQQRMALIQEQLAKEKDVRAAQMQENTELREKIQKEITKYNSKESDYQSQMKAYQNQMLQIEQKFKNQIEGTIQKQLAVAKDAKDKYDQAVSSCETLAGQIKGVVDKFDEIKVEINSSSKKMEGFKQEVEMKQMEIKLLETQIENQNLLMNKKAALQAEIDGEGPKLRKQVETLQNLKKALEVQLSNS